MSNAEKLKPSAGKEATDAEASDAQSQKRNSKRQSTEASDAPGSDVTEELPEEMKTPFGVSEEDLEDARRSYLLKRFWLSARGFWGKHGDPLSWVLSGSLLALILANLAVQYGINVWNRSIFDALEKKDAA